MTFLRLHNVNTLRTDFTLGLPLCLFVIVVVVVVQREISLHHKHEVCTTSLKSRVCEVTRLVEEAGMIKVSTAFGGSGFILAETDEQTDVHAKADQEWRLKSSWLPGTLSVRSCNKDKGFHRNMSQIP